MSPTEASAFQAVERGDMGRLMMSISRGIDLNIKNEDQKTLLMVACDHEEERQSFVQYILQAGASPLGASSDGRTPLHMVCEKKIINTKTLDLLLDHEIPLNQIDKNGRTALHLLSERRWMEGCMNLLDSSPKPVELCNQQDQMGRTALFLSSNCPSVACLLLSYGADPRIADQNGDSPMDLIKDPLTRAMAHLKAKSLFQIEAAQAASSANDGEFADLMSHSKVVIARDFLSKNLGIKPQFLIPTSEDLTSESAQKAIKP